MSQMTITLQGNVEMKHMLDRMAGRIDNMQPVMWKIREDIYRVIKATFESQGRRGGGSWAHLSEGWTTRKIKMGWDPRILYGKPTQTLLRSLTVRGHYMQRSKVGRHSVDLSSRVVYADVQQHGNADIPARPFINFTQYDRDRWAGMVAKHVMEATRGVK